MPALPNIDFEAVSYLFGVTLACISVFWSINKAIIIAKSH
jgi:hypothetical protein